jgi:hypothetical protein
MAESRKWNGKGKEHDQRLPMWPAWYQPLKCAYCYHRLSLSSLPAENRVSLRDVNLFDEVPLTVSGRATEYARATDAGGEFRSFFCPLCGSTVYVTMTAHPGITGVPTALLGALQQKPPTRSVWEQYKASWLILADVEERHQTNR